MIKRKIQKEVEEALARQAAVALIGPRQVGKTTLAQQLGDPRQAVYLDMEDAVDRGKLADPGAFIAAQANRLIIFDEIHRMPDLFLTLRGQIDQGRRAGLRTGRFLLLGSASLDLLKQSGESLAGRISYVEMTPFMCSEIGAEPLEKLWLRGGFPESFLAEQDKASFAWRRDLLRTYLERDVPMFGSRVPAETLRRFWTMLAHNQAGMVNASRLAASLEASSQSISRYVDLLVDLLLVRRLQPYLVNIAKRQVKSPKLYIRDSGLLHALLNIADLDALLGHPICGASWEGFAIENLIAAAPAASIPGFYRTGSGAEIDLVMELPGGEIWAIEIKRGRLAKPGRGFYQACADLQPTRRFVVHAGLDNYPLPDGVEAVGLYGLIERLASLSQ